MSPIIVVKNRWLGFLIWQTLTTTSLSLIILLINPTFTPLALLSFLTFHLSLLLLSFAFFLLVSPHPDPHASPSELAISLLRVSFKSLLGFSGPSLPPDARHRAQRSLAAVLFLLVCVVSGFISVVSSCGGSVRLHGMGLIGLGLRGSVFGLVYGVHYVYLRRWVLQFPIIQRPLFYSFKMGISSSLMLALKISTLAFVCSSVLMAFLPDQFRSRSTLGELIIQQIKFYICISVVSFSWELSHHLLQVVHTRRFVFALPQGSASAEANPIEPLLDAIEQSSLRSLIQYLAYLDLCMVTENNAESWRRAVFFEETGETYWRVVSVCLRPLEQFTSRLAEALEGSPVDKSDLHARQLNSPMDANMGPRLLEVFNDFQLCTWCAKTAGALTARSHREDRYGVAQLNGCNTAVVSTLLSCLLAVEACMGKKTSPQPSQSTGPTSIRWATAGMARKDGVAAPVVRKSGVLQAKAYAMADVLRTSVYQIVTAFQDDMQASAKALALEKTWIAEGKPLYGTREILAQKLALFVEFRAT